MGYLFKQSAILLKALRKYLRHVSDAELPEDYPEFLK